MNISFLTSGHYPYDDRIFFHLGKTLSENGYRVEIVSSKSNIKEISQEISINSFNGDDLAKITKIERFVDCLNSFNPDLVICSEPLPILAARKYDITEWNPSPEYFSSVPFPGKCFAFLKLIFINFTASYIADAFIFGEWYKSRPYRFLFPFKPFIFTTYYPDLKYIEITEPQPLTNKLNLIYSGRISISKGFGNFMKVVKGVATLNDKSEIKIKIIGWYESEHDKKECEPYLSDPGTNVTISFVGRQGFNDFIAYLKEADIFIDLREDNFENRFSLPIKLFYYAAAGRPVIFSDFPSIKCEVDTGEFGFPVKPDNYEEIIHIISGYLENSKLYLEQCRKARRLAEVKCNWQKISPEFLKFIGSFCPHL
jgi:glycosyltransferase involved in cell wall biosynthesis